MEFIKDDRANFRQVRRVLDHAGEDAFGHNLNPRGRACFAVAAHAVADGLPHPLAQGLRHAFGSGTRGQTAGFKHEDTTLHRPRLKQGKGHTGGFACAGRGLQNGAACARKGGDQLGQDIINRQAHRAAKVFRGGRSLAEQAEKPL